MIDRMTYDFGVMPEAGGLVVDDFKTYIWINYFCRLLDDLSFNILRDSLEYIQFDLWFILYPPLVELESSTKPGRFQARSLTSFVQGVLTRPDNTWRRQAF